MQPSMCMITVSEIDHGLIAQDRTKQDYLTRLCLQAVVW